MHIFHFQSGLEATQADNTDTSNFVTNLTHQHMSSIEDDFSDIRSLAANEGGSLSSGSLNTKSKGTINRDNSSSQRHGSNSTNG